MKLNSDVDKQFIRPKKKFSSGLDLEYDEIMNSFADANNECYHFIQSESLRGQKTPEGGQLPTLWSFLPPQGFRLYEIKALIVSIGKRIHDSTPINAAV